MMDKMNRIWITIEPMSRKLEAVALRCMKTSILVFRHKDSSLSISKNVTSPHPVAAHHHLFSDVSMLGYTPLLLP
jgi:hypothetical protein